MTSSVPTPAEDKSQLPMVPQNIDEALIELEDYKSPSGDSIGPASTDDVNDYGGGPNQRPEPPFTTD